MNFPLALYNRQRPSRFLSAASPFIAVLLTLLIGCLIFAGMGKEEAIIGPSQVEFVFVVSIHLIDDGEFAMDHLIV